MQIPSFEQIGGHYQHVYLSPHLDDAPLSCGGAILARRAAGEGVLVVTISTAAPPAEGPFSALAQRFHADWGLSPEQVVTARLVEERCAMQRVDADYWWAGRLDAIYRAPEAYESMESLFGTSFIASDPLLADLRQLFGALAERLPQATFYAPLAIGHHVDHQITHRAALEVLRGRVLFYEDVPYINWPGAIEQRHEELGPVWQPQRLAIGAQLAGKLESIECYASQLSQLFGSTQAMREVVSAYAERVRPEGDSHGEQVWRPA